MANQNPIKCNYDPNIGTQGFTGVGENPVNPGNTGAYDTYLDVNAGEFYVLLINNFSNTNSGFNLIFTGSLFDGGNAPLDCSILNTDGILGPDLDICDMSSTTLDANPANDPDFVGYTWSFNDGSGSVPIAGTDGMSTITVSDAGIYQVTITDNNGNSDSDAVEVIVTPIPTANAINPQFICDDNNDGFWDFNFSSLNTLVLGTQSSADFSVTYHTNIADAITGNNPIIGVYQNQNAYTAEIIHVRVQSNGNRDCASTTSFQIDVFNTPSINVNAVNDLLICDDDNDGFWDFDFGALRPGILGTQSATENTITFHLSEADALAGSTTNPLPDIYNNANPYQNEIIWIRVENNDNTNCFETTSFQIGVFESPTANSVPSQLICDDNNNGFWDFDLDAIRTTVLGTQNSMQFDIRFYSSQADADTGLLSNQLPDIYTNLVAYAEETIYVRIENVDNPICEDTSINFIIDVFDDPTALAYTYALCDDAADGDDTNGFLDFPLSPTIDSQILGTQNPSQFTVTYHLDQNSADNDSAPITNIYTDDRQIIVRVENNDNPSCFDTAIIDLVVNPLPIISNTVDLLQCDNDTDGISDFNLTESEVLISANAANETFTYHLSVSDANTGASPISNPLIYQNTDPSSNPDIIFVRVETSEGCYRVSQLQLFVSATQIPNTVEILYEECDTDADGDITNGITSFDFSSAEAQIRAQSGLPIGQNLTFTYYESETDALAETNAIPDISNHVNAASPFEQEIYVRVDSDVDNACVGLGIHVRLRTINPTPNTNPAPIVLCDDITVGDLVETFNLRDRELFILNGDPDVVASYHLSEVAANDGINAIPNPDTYQNTNPEETIFVRVTNSNTSCYAIVELLIRVDPLPDANVAVTDLFECENNTDFIFDFDLESKIPEILNGQNPAEFTVTFHDSQQDADDLVDALPNPYPNTSNPQQIFVAITNNATGCSISTLSFNIEVFESAEANDDGDPIIYEICDETNQNDGFAQFDLATQNEEIYDGQDPAAFSLTYHDSLEDAENNVQPLPTLYENLTNPQVIYARVSNVLKPEECFAISELTLQVNLLPIFDLEDEYILCLSSNNEAVVDVPLVLDTQLSDADYDFVWSLDGAVLPTQTSSSLIPTVGGLYSVEVTDTSTSLVTRCTNFDETLVIESAIPDTFIVDVTSEAFTGNNMIIAQATGSSSYEFSLDNGPWQLFGEFTDVSGGDHTVYVRDINGCGIVSSNVVVIDYPKFFTPNGDGNNDTWTIKGIGTQPQAVIYIFDRLGKLIKQLSPTNPGWDGTFNGNRMPSTDYWFTLQYLESTSNEMRTFSAHFTLKR